MKLITIPGVAVPFPYGGRFRQISVDLDGSALLAKGLIPVDVVEAIGEQNLTLPTGTAKIGSTEYSISLNGSPSTIAQLNDIPVKTSAGTTIYLKFALSCGGRASYPLDVGSHAKIVGTRRDNRLFQPLPSPYRRLW